MFLVADHGLRPGKVVWSVIVVIGAFWLAFRYIFGVVAFEPKTKDGSPLPADTPLGAPQLWPVTWLFRPPDPALSNSRGTLFDQTSVSQSHAQRNKGRSSRTGPATNPGHGIRGEDRAR
jgi:hypothetical protein